MSNICSKANRKLSASKRVTKFLPLKKRRILLKAFIEWRFKYCPFVWMFQGKQSNDKINKLHERTLSIVCNDTITQFEELLLKNFYNTSSKY